MLGAADEVVKVSENTVPHAGYAGAVVQIVSDAVSAECSRMFGGAVAYTGTKLKPGVRGEPSTGGYLVSFLVA